MAALVRNYLEVYGPAPADLLPIGGIKILELVNYRKDTGDKNAVTPFDSRSRVI